MVVEPGRDSRRWIVKASVNRKVYALMNVAKQWHSFLKSIHDFCIQATKTSRLFLSLRLE